MDLFSLANRRRAAEWMDDPAADPVELQRSLAFIRRINTWLGYNRATIGHLDALTRDWQPGRNLRILDVATGSADVPIELIAWAKRRRLDLQLVGIDLHARTVEAARSAIASASAGRQLHIIQSDATALPFTDGTFDFALTSMFLHHLDEAVIVRVLKEMNRVARCGLIVADLLRRKRAYFWISLFTVASNPMVRHDARVSVRQAFTRKEVLDLRDRAGLTYCQYHGHFGHRFVLAGRKPLSAATSCP